MKNILITGANSYIGTSFEKWVSQWPDKYKVDTLDMKDESWKEKDFSEYDVIFHVAAIVHVKENDTDKYFKVNRDLAIEVASKAKQEGVKQFLFLSTMGVYGTETGHITNETVPNPKTPYAKSKYEAEKELLKMNTDNFRIAILRPPIVYGKGCRGNYPRLAKLALKLPVFPEVNNRRSMIYIDNLCEFIKLLIDSYSDGLFFPQNKEYVNTTELIILIRKIHGKKTYVTRLFNLFIKVGLKYFGTLRKVFGTFVYDKKMLGGSENKINKEIDYKVVNFEESIKRTEYREQF